MGIGSGEQPSKQLGEICLSKEHIGDEVEKRLKPMLEGYFEGVQGISFWPTEKNSKEDVYGVDGYIIVGENGACRVPVDFTCATEGGGLEEKKAVVEKRNEDSRRFTPLASQIILIALPSWFQEKVLGFPSGGSEDSQDREEVARITTELFLKELGDIDPDAFMQAARILRRIYPH